MAFLPWAPVQDIEGSRRCREIAERHGATPHQVGLAWLLARSPVMLPIPGTGSVAHLEENIAAAGLKLASGTIRAERPRLRSLLAPQGREVSPGR